MDVSLHANCIDTTRQAFRASIPLELYNQLSPERKAELKMAYDGRNRSYDTSNYQFDPNFRVSYPAQTQLRFDSLFSEKQLTLDSMKAPRGNDVTSEELLPFMEDTVYVDPKDRTRNFAELLDQYKLPEDGIPPKMLTPAEYLAHLKRANKALQAGICKLDTEIVKKTKAVISEEVTEEVAPYVAAAAGAGVAVLKEIMDAKKILTVADVSASVVHVWASLTATRGVLDQLYGSRRRDDDADAVLASYYALGLSPDLTETVEQIAAIHQKEGLLPSIVDEIGQRSAKMSAAEKILFFQNLASVVEEATEV